MANPRTSSLPRSSSGAHAHLRTTEEKLAWIAFLARIGWDLFFTLTFDPRRGDVDRRRAESEAQWWLSVLSKVVRYDLGWTLTTERHASGAWHVHGLLKGLNSDDVALARWIWQRRHGKPRIVPVTDQAGVAAYITKNGYATNDILVSDNMVRHARAAANLAAPEKPAQERRFVGSTNSAAVLGRRAAKPGPSSAFSTNMPADLEPAESMAGASTAEGTASLLPGRPQVAGCADGPPEGVVAHPGADDAVGGERAPGEWRVCAGCGRQFIPRRPAQRCCTARCRAELSRRKRDQELRLVMAAIVNGDIGEARVRLAWLLHGEPRDRERS